MPASGASIHEVAAASVRRGEVVAELASKANSLRPFSATPTTPFMFLKEHGEIYSAGVPGYLFFRTLGS